MPLEACILVLDNSEYSRNGDYLPDRFGAQTEAVNVIFQTKVNSNPESTVGLMQMAGQSPQVLATLTHDHGKLLSGLNNAQIGGQCDFVTAMNVAQLALKHRENKNQRQRVVAFVGSPIVGDAAAATGDAGGSGGIRKVTEDALVKLGKKLRKNNVAVDIVTFGEEAQADEAVLRTFVNTVGEDTSHLVTVPTGSHLLSDVVARSEVLAAERAARGGGGGGAAMAVDDFGDDVGGGGDDFGGIDPDMDPELAMAIRMSMQEEEERQRRAAAAASSSTAAPSGESTADQPSAQTTVSAETVTHPPPAPAETSSAGGANVDAASNAATVAPSTTTAAAPADEDQEMAGGDEEDDDEDEEMLRAIAMSLESQNKEQQGDGK